MIIKMCGFTRPVDAINAVHVGGDWIGLNFWPASRRYVELDTARAIADAARAERDVSIVGIFVNQPQVDIDAAVHAVRLDCVQLHGDETPQECAQVGRRYMKAMALSSEADIERMSAYDCDVFVVDTPTAGYGGSGLVGSWPLATTAARAGHRILLAGGLTPDNVAEAIATVQPFGVDVAGGIESVPGIKDVALMEAFVDRVRDASRRMPTRVI